MRNTAVIGCGYWGKNLVRVFDELGALKVVCDTDKTKLGIKLEQRSAVKVVDRVSALWKEKAVEAVVIATPAATHYELARQCLLSGKHVFVEKPLALKVEEGQALVNLAKDLKKVLMVGHILQYHPAVVKLKELITAGEMGKIEYIYSNRLNIGKLRREENILWSFAPHDISTILMILDEYPSEVKSFGGKYLQENVYDTSLTTLDFPSGVKAHIFVSWIHPFKEQKFVVVGSKQMAVFDDLTDEKLFLYPHKIEWKDRVPVAHKAQRQIVPVENGEPLKIECRHFLDCISNGARPRTDGEEGLRVLRVLSAAEASLAQNGRAVEISDKKTVSYFIHPSSYVDEDVKIGEGTQVWHFSHVLKGSQVGKKCKIGQNVVIGPYVSIGNGCKIQNNVSIYKGVTLEDRVFCGPSCVFTNIINPRSAVPRMDECSATLVKKGATIGANATILCGHTLGKYSFVGAGAVVTRDVPDYALVLGNPARQTGWMCECGIKLKLTKNKALCDKCGKGYQLKNNRFAQVGFK